MKVLLEVGSIFVPKSTIDIYSSWVCELHQCISIYFEHIGDCLCKTLHVRVFFILSHKWIIVLLISYIKMQLECLAINEQTFVILLSFPKPRPVYHLGPICRIASLLSLEAFSLLNQTQGLNIWTPTQIRTFLTHSRRHYCYI